MSLRTIRKSAADAAFTLMKQLPSIPVPWNVGELCERLAERRGRSLLLHRLTIPALPSGLWYDDGKRDHVIYRSGLTGYYRDHIILHEICHMLARHNSAADTASSLVARAAAYGYTVQQEELAETFAAKVLKLARHTHPRSRFALFSGIS
jgi:hypothetical protein